jgi:tetratricopeptide (TPR) repeat protein
LKNYSKIVPIVLIFLFVAGVYNIYNSNSKVDKEYAGYLNEARKYAESGIVVDAVDNYLKALELKDGFDVRLEVGEVLIENDQFDEAVKWGEDLAEGYPHNAKAYEYIMKLYYDNENYSSFFKEYDVLKKRDVSSKDVEKMAKAIEYTYFNTDSYDDVKLFAEGYCAVADEDVWGYVNEWGAQATGLQYQSAGTFSGELAPITTADNSAYFINKSGKKKFVAPADAKAKILGPIVDQVYTVNDGAVWNIYSEDGKKLAGGFDEISSYSDGSFAAKKGDGWSIIDKAGKTLSKDTYEEICTNENGVAVSHARVFAIRDGDVVLLDATGKVVKKTGFEKAMPFVDDSYAAVLENGAWGFVDKSGKFAIEPQYEEARSFSNGFAAVKKFGKWGFINVENKMLIEPVFEDAKDFSSEGSVFVRQGDNWTLLRLYKYNHY